MMRAFQAVRRCAPRKRPLISLEIDRHCWTTRSPAITISRVLGRESHLAPKAAERSTKLRFRNDMLGDFAANAVVERNRLTVQR